MGLEISSNNPKTKYYLQLAKFVNNEESVASMKEALNITNVQSVMTPLSEQLGRLLPAGAIGPQTTSDHPTSDQQDSDQQVGNSDQSLSDEPSVSTSEHPTPDTDSDSETIEKISQFINSTKHGSSFLIQYTKHK
jgi:hypothetical protein